MNAQQKRDRQAYQRAYYQANKEKAKEYQRQYNLSHKKKRDRRGKVPIQLRYREARTTSISTSTLLHLSTEKTITMINKILKGQVHLSH